jgi:hypothetical protein
MNQGIQGYRLTKKPEGQNSRDTASLKSGPTVWKVFNSCKTHRVSVSYTGFKEIEFKKFLVFYYLKF